jgi:hypothetical protein
MNDKKLLESFCITEKQISETKDIIESKLKKRMGKYYSLMENIYSANDWVEKNKFTLQNISKLFVELRNIFIRLTEKSLSNQEYIDELYERLYAIDQAFAVIAMSYVRLADNRKRPLTTKASHNLKLEMLAFWDSVFDELEKTKKIMAEFKGKMMIRNIWNQNPKLHKFFDKIEKTTVADVEKRLKNNENPIGQEFDVFSED